MKVKRTWIASAILFLLLNIISMGLPIAALGADQDSDENKMGYINPHAPLVPYPAYKGKSYEDRVPDTLDIAEMAKLTINALTACTDPNADYLLYFWVSLSHNPSRLQHSGADHCNVKFMEALPLLRIVSGSEQNTQVDKVWMESIQKSIGPDGLYYIPLKGWPWIRSSDTGTWNECVFCKDDGTTMSLADPSYMHLIYGLGMGRVLDIISIYYLRDKNPMWLEIGNRMVDRLNELYVDKGDYAYLPSWGFGPNAKLPADAPMPKGFTALDHMGRVPEGLGKYYAVTRYEPAKKLAEKITRYMRYHAQYFDDKGAPFDSSAQQADPFHATHFHAHTIGLLSMLEYAIPAGDHDTVDYVKRGYEWWKTQGCDLTGYFPEGLMEEKSLSVYGNSCETCEIADMIALGLKLTDAGVGDYWDDVDRWLRNQFAENQFTNLDWVKKASEANSPEPIGPYDASDNAAERCLGSFAGWATPNDSGDAIMHCCTGNAARSIYYVWEHILSSKNGKLRVNLLMNRASEWADVYSHVPYEGKVDLKIKKNFKNVLVRMPEWVKGTEIGIACTVNGQTRDLKWEGRYVDVGSVKTGDKVTVGFPIYEWTTRQKIAGSNYTMVLKGSTVVSIDPPGTICPTYKREKYLKNKSDWKSVKRFISSEHLEW